MSTGARNRWMTLVLWITVAAACGGSASEGTATTSSVAVTAATTTTAPTTTSSSTTIVTGLIPSDLACDAAGAVGVWLPLEGNGVCIPPGGVATGTRSVVNVTANDLGLPVWTGPGAPGSKVPEEGKYQVVMVIPPAADGVQVTGHATSDGLWYFVVWQGSPGWARAAFLGMPGSPPPTVCPGSGIGAVPGSAIDVSSTTGDFDGDGDTDEFFVYTDAGVFYAHFLIDNGFGTYGARLTVGFPHLYTPFAGEISADTPHTAKTSLPDVTDLNGDGVGEAWMHGPWSASRDVSSVVVFNAFDCQPYHAIHYGRGGTSNSNPDQPVGWTVGASVGSGSEDFCFRPDPGGTSALIEVLEDPNTGALLILENTLSHYPTADPIAEFWGVTVLPTVPC